MTSNAKYIFITIDTQGQRTTRLNIERPAFDPRTRPWYTDEIAAKQGIWSPIYAGFTPGTIFIAASQPLYDPTESLRDSQLWGNKHHPNRIPEP
jgi:hypothetical protein